MIRLTRRTVLRGGATMLPLMALPAGLHGQSRAAQVSLLLDGVGPDLDYRVLEQIVAPFLSSGLPLCCVADLAALTAPDVGGRPLLDLLARLALGDPGLFELALPIGKLPRTERYFQLRRAAELRDAVARAFGRGPAADRSFPVVTLIDRVEDPNIDHTAFRGAGFRIHLRAGDGPVQRTIAGRGELVMSGGIWAGLAAPDLGKRLSVALGDGGDILLSLSLAGLTLDKAADLAVRSETIARDLAKAMVDGRIVMATPAQLRLFIGDGLPLDVALLVEPGDTLEEQEALLAFVRDLAGQGVPLTLTGKAEQFGELPGTVHFCALPPADAAEAAPPADCQRDTDDQPDALSLPVPVHVAAEEAVWTRQGIGPDGRLRLTLRRLAGSGPDAVLDLSPLEDHVIAIRAADVLLPVQRAQLLRRFLGAAQSGQAYFHTVPGLAEHLVSTEPVLARLWSVRRRSLTDPLVPPAPDADERVRLLDDARLAWLYIDRFTDERTGRSAGTVQLRKTTIINREATMWDLASQLHGIRVAGQLSLIEAKEARERARLLIDNLPLAEIDGNRLPPAMFRTDSDAIVTPGFDICDVGRFMIALRSAVSAGLLEAAEAETVVAGWDLAAALPGGRPHTHVGGKWIDTTLSHCTPYIRRGMADWGFDLVSSYAGLVGGSPTDDEIALLYDVARIGQVGVEPTLLEIVELGPDPASGLIADVLFDAQLTWLETTGQLKSASEAPLNFPPWFSYQGLRFGYLGDAAWIVRGLGGAAEYDTPEFRSRAELLSAKSAYLWATVRSHPYSDRLLTLMRNTARIDGLGFSVGVFASTMQAMPGYSDLNTNGVILEAIGHTLR
ncbi:MAG: hypothetical protein C0524_11980 [Rhodobacter sp.]|nr:hypothetical protein [Rhodobacter sp.]